MKTIAHRGKIDKENTIEGVLEIADDVDIVEIDVRYSTDRTVVLCHDREKRNDAENCTLHDFLSAVSDKYAIMIDIKAFGIEQARRIAASVVECIRGYKHLFYLCSFNDYCVDELISIREEREQGWRIGTISSGVPLGMFNHLDVDFVSLDYSIVCEDLMDRLHTHDNKVEVFAWVVNDAGMRKMMSMYGIDGIIMDF
tara:strand:+ start:1072 stop:1665 length:594 start_codon:yes stop_codon:yes gene_type:complete